MKNGGTVTVDADRAAELLAELRREVNVKIDNFGRFLAAGMVTKASVPARRRPAEKASKEEPAMVLELDISGIEWQTKAKQPAGPDDPWNWAFGYNRDGTVRRETNQLVQAILQYGTVRIGQYEFSLGGRDNNLLNRRRV